MPSHTPPHNFFLLESLVDELGVPFYTQTLLFEKLNALLMSHNPVLNACTNNIELDIHFVRERVVAKKLMIQHVLVIVQIEDTLTKPLGFIHFQDL